MGNDESGSVNDERDDTAGRGADRRQRPRPPPGLDDPPGSGILRGRERPRGSLRIGSGESADFTPVELLLTAIAGCSAVDVDAITSRRAEPATFSVAATGTKDRDEERGNHMRDLEVTFTVTFPPGEAGDRAREMLPRAVAMSRDRLCTVSRTVQLGIPVAMRVD